MPTIEEVAKEKVFLKNPKVICLTPSGLGLVDLFEEELGTDLVKDLNHLQKQLTQAFHRRIRNSRRLRDEYTRQHNPARAIMIEVSLPSYYGR